MKHRNAVGPSAKMHAARSATCVMAAAACRIRDVTWCRSRGSWRYGRGASVSEPIKRSTYGLSP